VPAPWHRDLGPEWTRFHRPAALHQPDEALGTVLAPPQPALPPLRPAPARTARRRPPPGNRPWPIAIFWA